MSAPLELPSWRCEPDDRARVAAQVRAWTRSDALVDLVRSFGGGGADHRDLAALDRFASARWDFRAGRERDQAGVAELTDRRIALVGELAPVLGLADRETPGRPFYDVVLLTGGMVRAGLVKPRFVSELARRGIRFDRVAFVGGHREFSAEENALAAALGVDGNDEVDGMLEGMRRQFGPAHDPVVEFGGSTGWASWGSWRWPEHVPVLEVIAAPSADPGSRRANTADTFRFWARRFREDACSVLVVTTPIYVPYQAAVAVETLGLESGLAVDTVGVSTGANDLGPHTQPFTPAHHLQELRSAIRGMLSLERALGRPPLQ